MLLIIPSYIATFILFPVKLCANAAPIWSFMPRNLPEAEYSMMYSSSYEGECEDQSFRMGYDTEDPPCEVAHIYGGRKRNKRHYVGVKFNGSVMKITAIRIQGYGGRNTKGVNAFSLKYEGPRGKALWYKNAEVVKRVGEPSACSDVLLCEQLLDHLNKGKEIQKYFCLEVFFSVRETTGLTNHFSCSVSLLVNVVSNRIISSIENVWFACLPQTCDTSNIY